MNSKKILFIFMFFISLVFTYSVSDIEEKIIVEFIKQNNIITEDKKITKIVFYKERFIPSLQKTTKEFHVYIDGEIDNVFSLYNNKVLMFLNHINEGKFLESDDEKIIKRFKEDIKKNIPELNMEEYSYFTFDKAETVGEKHVLSYDRKYKVFFSTDVFTIEYTSDLKLSFFKYKNSFNYCDVRINYDRKYAEKKAEDFIMNKYNYLESVEIIKEGMFGLENYPDIDKKPIIVNPNHYWDNIVFEFIKMIFSKSVKLCWPIVLEGKVKNSTMTKVYKIYIDTVNGEIVGGGETW
ncbi:MAG: hypothetical protein M0R46_15295 [Candidatus Muirbacterium halophilum]|nr:hypothetical protein [Candidatus Muirbacterium halophilum]MCK9477281.1 hypothetical protein [Candidatus Muirbacterium halophilum]